jgi:hypothetical protein
MPGNRQKNLDRAAFAETGQGMLIGLTNWPSAGQIDEILAK